MNMHALPRRADATASASGMARTLYGHVAALFPLCRSITGDGLRSTLRYIASHIPLEIHEVPSGTEILDWRVPPEWTVREAWLRTLDGRTIVDFRDSNLHLLQYSRPVERVVGRAELEAHLHSLPEQPDVVPYRTGYYADDWGFCLADRDRRLLSDPEYRVRIDTTLAPGSLSYGECVIAGDEPGEVLLSAHCCHPSLANDNLSGIAVALELARTLLERPRRRFTYRFLFAPGTLGAIAWLHACPDAAQRVRHGLVLSNLGDAAAAHYKRSRRGNAPIDRYATYVFREAGNADGILPFSPDGYDERQFCSPGFNLPMGCLMRSPPGSRAEYHTSADNLGYVVPAALAQSLQLAVRILDMAEADRVWVNLSPYGEPQLGRRGLYGAHGGRSAGEADPAATDTPALRWVLNLADGEHTLLDIAERSGLSFARLACAADVLAAADLLAERRVSPPPAG